MLFFVFALLLNPQAPLELQDYLPSDCVIGCYMRGIQW